MIKAVILDIDDTMYSFTGTHKVAMGALLTYIEEQFGVERERAQALLRECMDIVTERTGDSAAQHNRLIRFQCFLEQIGSTDYRRAMEMYHAYWDTLLKVMEPEPGLLSLVSRLKEKGIRLGVGSDMTAYIQYKKLEKLGVLPYLDFIVVSEEAGAEKPTRRFFDLCVEKAGCRPGECVFIGDNLKKDVLGAAACGLVGTWYRPGGEDTDVGQGVPTIKSFEDYLPGEE